MRGQKIFKDILNDSGLTSTIHKGRNHLLVTKRNECLVARYYYYAGKKSKCYEEILRTLVAEFFLSPSTISFIVMEHMEQLQALKNKRPSLYYFQNRWPHLKW